MYLLKNIKTVGKKNILTQQFNYKKQQIPPKLRQKIWYNFFANNLVGICYCCKKEVHNVKAGWHCSHVIAEKHGGTLSFDNLRVCCAKCNLSMGTTNMYTYINSNFFS